MICPVSSPLPGWDTSQGHFTAQFYKDKNVIENERRRKLYAQGKLKGERFSKEVEKRQKW
jgi:hypothetical protein